MLLLLRHRLGLVNLDSTNIYYLTVYIWRIRDISGFSRLSFRLTQKEKFGEDDDSKKKKKATATMMMETSFAKSLRNHKTFLSESKTFLLVLFMSAESRFS